MKERLLVLMNKKNINQSDLSKITGITQSSLSDYIKGKYEPKQDKIEKIAKALKVSPIILMGWENSVPLFQEINSLNDKEIELVRNFIGFLQDQKGQENVYK